MDLHLALIALPVGLIATFVMDVGARALSLVGQAGRGERRTGPHLLGRWVGYMPRGIFRHEDITRTPPLSHELALGFLTHYAIGWSLGLLYLWGLDLTGVHPTLFNAVLFALATTIFAWFLLFPAWGMGWFGAAAAGATGSRTRLARSSLGNHAVFGLGLALAVAVFDPLG